MAATFWHFHVLFPLVYSFLLPLSLSLSLPFSLSLSPSPSLSLSLLSLSLSLSSFPSIAQIESLLLTQVTEVQCGHSFSVVLLTGGQLYSWGDNTYGQLGLGGKDYKSHRIPK